MDKEMFKNSSLKGLIPPLYKSYLPFLLPPPPFPPLFAKMFHPYSTTKKNIQHLCTPFPETCMITCTCTGTHATKFTCAI